MFVGFLIIVSLFLSHWLTDRLLEPVRRIAEHLRQMDPMRVEEWKTLEGAEKGEYLGPITKGINLLIEKARASLEQLWKMSRYVAHELRTPLTILRGEAETVLLKSGATKEDYEKVSLPMLPVVAGEEVTRRYIVLYSLLLVPLRR